MPPRKQWIDKKTASTFQLFHRSQHDPLIHEANADDRVLHQVSGPAPSSASTTSNKPSRNLSDLQSEFRAEAVRQNEGEAANHGVYFDDSKYDYMQHLRELGTGGGDSHFVEANIKGKGKANKGLKLEDALRQVSLDEGADAQSALGGRSLYGSEYGDMRSTTTSYSRKPTYQDQQNVPDAIAGFQPDMDPRLREALEALEDDEFVDDEDDDLFGELTANAEEMETGDWEDTIFDHDEEDDGWESDATEKAPAQTDSTKTRPHFTDKDSSEPGADPDLAPGEMPEHDQPAPDMHPEDQEWMQEFARFKKHAKTGKLAAPAAPTIAPSQTMASTVFTAGGTPIRRKKRKGAMTNPSAYSMSSSALARTEGHRLLDDRFDKVEALYAVDEDEEYDDSMSMVSGMTGATGMTGMSAVSSQAPSLVSAGGDATPTRSDFNNVMDDFLSSWDDNTSAQVKRKGAKAKRGKNGNEAIGIRMLDEVRQGLGSARLSNTSRNVPGRA
ncbi:hypothetical protein NUU61_001853 [Penicillium alfredii]|uniref:Low temperature viability protein n=1 Tax=Penicillium alfredii TaxID=1506179 RepID=A0A9W9KG38_9EURO|nr:uncharacterized protein NUU61_001853 [Penicillium alfredii]KAJ5104506.1 hypothetical protein NUU61_001853 [Penicillium alfredii]